ncbi:MAG: HAD family hydrolase [Frankia sp.]
MKALHVFDMDGTLLCGSTAAMEVARRTGHSEALRALEARFEAREIDTETFMESIYVMWQGLTPAMVAEAFAASPWLLGIREVCSDIRAHGGWSTVITLSPDFFAMRLLGLGFDHVIASRFSSLPFNGRVESVEILKPSDKVRVVDELRKRYGVAKARCVAYGDSLSDEPLFRHLSATVAVNPTAELARIGRACYVGNNLNDAYAIARSLLIADPR